jgi:hypothetical protein
MSCAICEKRRPRRYCPAVRGEICTQCCGTERENSILCPNDCEYLIDAREHERGVSLNPEIALRRGIEFSNEVLEDLMIPIYTLSAALQKAAVEAGALDADVREALASLIDSYQTLERSGLIYEGLPSNPIAAALHREVKLAAEDFLEKERRQFADSALTEKDVFAVLAFLEVLATQRNNGRKYCRSYLWSIGRLQAPAAIAAGPDETDAPSLLLP